MAASGLIFATVVACACYNLAEKIEGFSEQLVEEVKEKLQKEGDYTDFVVSKIHEIDAVTGNSTRVSSESIRHRRSAGKDDTPLYLEFAAFDKNFRMTVRYNHELLRADTPVTIVHDRWTEVYDGTIPDCLLYGQTDEHAAVSISYCNGIGGSIADGEYLYRIDPIGPMDDHMTETILVSKTHLAKLKDRTLSKADELVRRFTNDSTRTLEGGRSKRAYPDMAVEIGVYLDNSFWTILEAQGAMTNEKKIELVGIKWNGVQAMFGITDELGYNVILQIKGIVFWETNPGWFTFNVDDLDATLTSFCSNVRSQTGVPSYDHFHLHSEVKDSIHGLAYTPGTCVTNRCGIASDTDFYNPFISGHELGHSFGMRHDNDINGGDCAVEPTNGYMAQSGYPRIGWSACSKDALYNFFTNQAAADCLNFENVANENQVALTGVWAGMTVNKDQFCEKNHGAGWRKREFYMDVNVCTIYSCVNMNPGADFGIMETYNLHNYGDWCGERSVCNPKFRKCVTFEETLIPLEKITVTVGGWTDWGAAESCSRTCGTGLILKGRTCTNPPPLNSGPCDGSAYHGTICNTHSCTGEEALTPLNIRKSRAAETCQRLLDGGTLSATQFEASGDRRFNEGLGQCEVKCTAINGHTFSTTFRFSLMPDGVACNPDGIALTVPEQRGYPRGRGYQGLCMQGYCEVFGCDGQSGIAASDLCGVCGGDGSTCQPVDKIFCGPVDSGGRVTIVTIPAGATNLQFYFNYRKMTNWFVEMFDTSNSPLISFLLEGTRDTGTSPVTKAGTQWHYLLTTQHMYSLGPTTEDIVIKLHSASGGTNDCVSLGFSLPLDVTIPTFDVPVTDAPVVEPVTTAEPTTNPGSGTSGGTTTSSSAGTGTGTTSGTGTGTGGTGTGTGGTGTTSGTGTGGGITDDRCHPASFHCRTNDTCFSYEELCDNIDNCGDMSDEAAVFCQQDWLRGTAGMSVQYSVRSLAAVVASLLVFIILSH